MTKNLEWLVHTLRESLVGTQVILPAADEFTNVFVVQSGGLGLFIKGTAAWRLSVRKERGKMVLKEHICVSGNLKHCSRTGTADWKEEMYFLFSLPMGCCWLWLLIGGSKKARQLEICFSAWRHITRDDKLWVLVEAVCCKIVSGRVMCFNESTKSMSEVDIELSINCGARRNRRTHIDHISHIVEKVITQNSDGPCTRLLGYLEM